MSIIGDKLRALAGDVDAGNVSAIGIVLANGANDLVLTTADMAHYENHTMMLAYALYQATVMKRQEEFLQ